MSQGPIVFSHILNGKADPDGPSDIVEALRDDRLAWAHLDGTHEAAQAWIRDELDYLDPQAVEALLDVSTRPRISVVGEGLLVILRAINFNEGEDPEDMVSLRMYLDTRRIVTISRKRVLAIERMNAALCADNGPSDAGAFLVRLVEDIVGRINVFQGDLDARAETLEDQVFGGQGDRMRHDVLDLRLKVIAARRYIGPQRDALMQVAKLENPVIDPVTRREIEEEALKMLRVAEDMDELRDQAQVLREELSSQLSDRVNRNTFVLSVVTTIFLPLGFVTGLFGINVGGMPGTHSNSAFDIFVMGCAVLVAAQLAIMELVRRWARRRARD
ncbi:magnesium transporter CorA [Thioclava dalianensis]|uniref:Magnesium transporter CorA n=1 Tax=Thioclava dalianensis TaxID=1185766 RepID=A0A074TGN2_9RHOB|nr:zinc transporter ZntB [Thioclava dalianensis]KEP68203.1 magnesium transporter CorA [Thioclava dalianensis]SFN87259.1 zinc transporter [Thioclava dalianensis]